MATPTNDIKRLLEKYREGVCTDEELALLESWYLQHEEKNLPEVPEAKFQQQADEIWAALPVHQHQTKQRNLWPRLAGAAILLMALSFGAYLYLKPQSPNLITIQTKRGPVVPGGNKAILTLANGNKINLTDAGSGTIGTQAGTSINKVTGGQIAYQPTNAAETPATAYNVIETPRGGQYQVVLPDGTKVWLNAASSIRFPANFSGMKERRVTITGEAYFDVVHNAAQPFVVSARGQQIRDIGTQFNVMSYEDEGLVKTTLVEGSVKLTQNGSSCLLRQAGQQGSGIPNLIISTVDLSQVTAWKNGLFMFYNTDLHTLMRQISRWYDVDIAYDPGVDNDVFFGKIERKADLQKVLKILETGGVHFRLDDHKLTVIK